MDSTKIIKFFVDSKGRQFSAIVVSDKHVHLYRNNTKKAIYYFSSPIVDICWDLFHPEVHLICIDVRGDIYSLSLPEFKKKKQTGNLISPDNQDIFASLIQSQSQTQSQVLQFQPSTEPVILVTENHKLMRIPEIMRLICLHQWFICVSRSSAGWNVLFYDKHLYTDGRCQLVGCILIPLRDTIATNADTTKEANTSRLQTMLLYADGHADNDILTSDMITLPLSLHERLFSTKLPVVLLSLPNGCIFQLPLSSSAHFDCLQFHLVYNATQPVTGMHSVIIKQTGKEDGDNVLEIPSLILVCHTGRVIAIHEDSQSEAVNYMQLSAVGPAVATSGGNSVLYISTGKDIFVIPLKVQEGRKNLATKSQGYSGVVGLARLTKKGQEADEMLPLLTVNKSGAVKVVDSKTSVNRQTSGSDAQRMKNLLCSIQNISELSARSQNKAKEQNEILSQLNIASLLTSRDIKSQPLVFDVSVISQNLGSFVEFYIHCKLSNASTIAISKGWCLMVNLQIPDDEEKLNITKTQMVSQLQPNDYQIISFPVSARITDCLPVTVQAILKYTFDRSHVSELCHNTVTVLLPGKVIDLINFLRMASTPTCGQSISQTSVQVERVVKDLAESRIGLLNSDDCKKTGHYTASICVAKISSKKRKADEVPLLKSLFKGTQLEDVDHVQDFVRALTPCGHQVSLSVASVGDQEEIVVQASVLSVLFQLRSSIQRKLQELPHRQKHVTHQDIRKYLSHIEEVKTELGNVTQSDHLNEEALVGLHSHLRKRPIP